MKRKLLYLTSIVLFSATSIKAQNVYDFGGENVAGYTNLTTAAVINGLYGPGLTVNGVLKPTQPGAASTDNVLPTTFTVGKFTFTPGGSARLRTNNPIITRYDESLGVTPAFTPAPTYTGRLAANGVGTATTKYNYKFALQAGDELTLLVSSDATGGSTNATYVIAGPTPATSSTTTVPLGVSYVIHISATVAGDYIFYDSLSKANVYRVYEANVTNAVLGTETFQEIYDVSIYANKGRIFLSDVKSATKISVYGVSGSLVKSVETSEDTSLDINNGLYIVKAQSAEGIKTVKVLVN